MLRRTHPDVHIARHAEIPDRGGPGQHGRPRVRAGSVAALSLVLFAAACGGGGGDSDSGGGGGGGGGDDTTTTPAIDATSNTDLDTVPDTDLDTVPDTDLDTVPDTDLDTVPDTDTTGTGGEVEYAASREFCAAWGNVGVSGFFTGTEGVEGIIAQFREQLTAALMQSPEELKPAIQELLDIEIDPKDPQATRAVSQPIMAEIDSFVAENCAPIPMPTFTFERSEQSGDNWVLFVTGVCPDGSFPVDVTGPSDRLFDPPFTAVDLGNGSYSLGSYNLPGYTEEQLLDELQILFGLVGTCA